MTVHDDPLRSALFTDLYQLTMAQAYDAEEMEQTAVFELYFRELPKNRNFVVAAGLETVLAYLKECRFTHTDIDYLRHQGGFSDRFLERLKNLRFTGDVYAVPEGTIVFPYEPLIQVRAPILEGQLVETVVLNQIHFQSVAASKAARVVLSAEGRTVVDFGSRRAHGTDAALQAARLCYLTGGAGTSNVLAGKIFGIPIFGTMAHSYIQAHDSEMQAFEAFSNVFPKTTLLVDTYDTLEGIRKVIALKKERGNDFHIHAVRLDSGDLAELAKKSRQMLDEAGLDDVEIFASSGLDEYKIADLLAAGAPIGGFGVGTKMAVSRDAPDLDMAYKLVEYAGKPRTKLSSDKIIYPGRKQIFRRIANDRMQGDVLAQEAEKQDGEPLLQPMMQRGRRLPASHVSLEDARQFTQRQLALLPPEMRQLQSSPAPYPVSISLALQKELEEMRSELEAAI